ncbi:MAG: hypothetical protein ACPL7M_01430 [Bryobacteraceae bacterium]
MPLFKRFFQKRKPRLTPDLAREIRRSFEEAAGDEEHFPSVIDPRILHVRAVLEGVAPLGPGSRVLDAGCGKGRFAVHVRNAYPQALVAALRQASPPIIARIAGDAVLLDPRTVPVEQDELLLHGVRQALGQQRLAEGRPAGGGNESH